MAIPAPQVIPDIFLVNFFQVEVLKELLNMLVAEKDEEGCCCGCCGCFCCCALESAASLLYPVLFVWVILEEFAVFLVVPVLVVFPSFWKTPVRALLLLEV